MTVLADAVRLCDLGERVDRAADWGACRKTRVVLQNRRPDQERTTTWGHDVRVLLSTYGGRGDVGPLVGLAVRLRRSARRCGCARRPTRQRDGYER